jgi:hypothetical protein
MELHPSASLLVELLARAAKIGAQKLLAMTTGRHGTQGQDRKRIRPNIRLRNQNQMLHKEKCTYPPVLSILYWLLILIETRFITDLDRWSLYALIGTASQSQASALKDAVYNYLTFKSFIGVRLSVSSLI